MNHWDATRYTVFKRDAEGILDDIKVLMKDKAEIVAMPGLSLGGDWSCDGLRKGQEGGGCPTLTGTFTTTAFAHATVLIRAWHPRNKPRERLDTVSIYSHLVVPAVPVSMGDMDLDTPTNIPKSETYATWTFRHIFPPETTAVNPFTLDQGGAHSHDYRPY
jgi:hypothetical protein